MHQRRLTRSMKILLSKNRYKPENWHYIKSTPVELIVVNWKSGKQKTIVLLKGGARHEAQQHKSS